MTRSTPLNRVAAEEDPQAPNQAPTAVPEPASMTFRVDEDNGGRYHWAVVADGAEILVRSAGFGSYKEAERAADIVRRGLSQASLAGSEARR